MMQGFRGSVETFCTFPPTAKARPEGVRRGWADLGGCGWALACWKEDEEGVDGVELKDVGAWEGE